MKTVAAAAITISADLNEYRRGMIIGFPSLSIRRTLTGAVARFPSNTVVFVSFLRSLRPWRLSSAQINVNISCFVPRSRGNMNGVGTDVAFHSFIDRKIRQRVHGWCCFVGNQIAADAFWEH
ncbi:hypothetical protein [Pararhizobium sp.]|uniref:hypothetical protein n=1 Tax=Pararhizobium sp. TaxID=1977563 RepID=UPI003D12782B